MKKKNQNIYRKRRLIVLGIIIFLVLLIIILTVINNLMDTNKNKDYYSTESKYEQIKTTIIEDSETLGWIRVQGTNIDYPIVYETNLVYLGLKDYTWLSNRYAEGNNRMAIYGHNIRNVSNKPLIADEHHVRFEQLMSFAYHSFAKKNLYIQYSHDGKDELYKIYAVGFYDKNEERGEYLTTEESIKEYIDTVRKKSIYDYDIKVDETDDIISLITCTRFFGTDEKTTFKVDARKVRKGEKISKYGVSKNKNYDILNLE